MSTVNTRPDRNLIYIYFESKTRQMLTTKAFSVRSSIDTVHCEKVYFGSSNEVCIALFDKQKILFKVRDDPFVFSTGQSIKRMLFDLLDLLIDRLHGPKPANLSRQ